MTKEGYARLSAPFRARPGAVIALDKGLTLAVYLAYPALLLWLLRTGDPRLLRTVVTPGASFLVVSLVRRWYNAPRPYEVLDIKPLIPKDTAGKSFPSRHAFSIFVIAAAFWSVCPPLGGVLLAAGVLLSAARVVGGVHFPRDVIAGAVIGLASGLLGFWLLP